MGVVSLADSHGPMRGLERVQVTVVSHVERTYGQITWGKVAGSKLGRPPLSVKVRTHNTHLFALCLDSRGNILMFGCVLEIHPIECEKNEKNHIFTFLIHSIATALCLLEA